MSNTDSMQAEITEKFSEWHREAMRRLTQPDDDLSKHYSASMGSFARLKTPHQERIEAFMAAGGHQVPDKPTVPSRECRMLRAKLILEECLETIQALGFEVVPAGDADHVHKHGVSFREAHPVNMIEVADGCADISVVTIGTLSAFGIADESLLREVDRSNMEKFRDGVKHDQYGKIMKPAGWTPPDVLSVLKDQGME